MNCIKLADFTITFKVAALSMPFHSETQNTLNTGEGKLKRGFRAKHSKWIETEECLVTPFVLLCLFSSLIQIKKVTQQSLMRNSK